jgi:hypothetical protein
MVAKYRTLIESERYTADLARIEPDVRRTDLIREDFDEDVACRAEFFPLIEGTTLRFLRTRPDLGGCPALWVYFTIDGPHYCTLQAARIAEELLPPSIFHDE